MKYLLDCHCHTIASGHAYSTVLEIAREASNKGLQIVGITDHGPKMPGSSHIYHIANQKVIPSKIYGVNILRGVEANIISYEGELDVPKYVLNRLDVVIAGLHDICIEPGSKEENTQAVLSAMENKYVDIIAHPGNPAFPINEKEVILKAKESDTLIEINNSSLGVSRKGSLKNCIRIAKLCKDNDVNVIVGSDSHIAFDVGQFEKVTELFNDIDMPNELIMNLYPNKFLKFLKTKEKGRFMDKTIKSKI